jgi:hypothetical protein
MSAELLSPFGHTPGFSDVPQVHSGAGGVINDGNELSALRNVVLTP